MRQVWREVLCEMRDAGYAVIVWTPEELQGVAPDYVEERSIELGHEVIDCLKGQEDA